MVLWTLGQGTGMIAGIQEELPTLGIALSDIHQAFVEFSVDNWLAMLVQKDLKRQKGPKQNGQVFLPANK